MERREHAIVATGYAWRTTVVDSPDNSPHAWSQVDALIVVDDNLLPYRCINLNETTESSKSNESYTTEDFDAFIAPLPEKIYYPADAIETFSIKLMQSSLKQYLGVPDEIDLVRRYFITTISSFRRFAREHQSQLGDELVNLFMCVKTAQFVWIVEYATYSQWARGHIATRAIIDATASPNETQPIWLIHNAQEAIVFDRSSANAEALVVDLKRSTDIPMGRMEQNLRPVKA